MIPIHITADETAAICEALRYQASDMSTVATAQAAGVEKIREE